MRMSPAGQAFLTAWEGVRLYVYRCAAKRLTIGVGHALTVEECQNGHIHIGDQAVPWREGITRDQVDRLLQQDLAQREDVINDVDIPLEQHQFDALVSFVFNVGEVAFLNSTMLRYLKQRRHDLIPRQFSRWVHAGNPPKRVPGLEARRRAEAKLYATGEYSGRS